MPNENELNVDAPAMNRLYTPHEDIKGDLDSLVRLADYKLELADLTFARTTPSILQAKPENITSDLKTDMLLYSSESDVTTEIPSFDSLDLETSPSRSSLNSENPEAKQDNITSALKNDVLLYSPESDVTTEILSFDSLDLETSPSCSSLNSKSPDSLLSDEQKELLRLEAVLKSLRADYEKANRAIAQYRFKYGLMGMPLIQKPIRSSFFLQYIPGEKDPSKKISLMPLFDVLKSEASESHSTKRKIPEEGSDSKEVSSPQESVCKKRKQW